MIRFQRKHLYLLFTLLFILLLSGVLDNLELQPGQKTVFSGEIISEQEIIRGPEKEPQIEAKAPAWIVFLFFIPLILPLLRLIRKLRFDPPTDKEWKTLLLLISLAVLTVLGISSLFISWFRHGTHESGTLEVREQSLMTDPLFEPSLSPWIVLPGAMILVILIFLTFALIKVILKKKDLLEVPGQLIAEQARESAAGIETGEDPFESVIRCYQQMCSIILENHGVERKDAMTAREFEKQLVEMGFADQHVSDLTTLFEIVRYGGNQMPGSEIEKRALQCLTAIAKHHD